jgi:hypothetical protein
MTAATEMWSTTTPPASAPRDSVAWNDEVNRIEAASGACGADLANQACEQTGTAPYAMPQTASSVNAAAVEPPATGSRAVAVASRAAAVMDVARGLRASAAPARKLPATPATPYTSR